MEQPGAVDKFLDDIERVIELVAKDTEEKGLLEDAVKLFDLAKVSPSQLSHFAVHSSSSTPSYLARLLPPFLVDVIDFFIDRITRRFYSY